MPLRLFNREQSWLLPPSLDELVGSDHPARFVDMMLGGGVGARVRGWCPLDEEA